MILTLSELDELPPDGVARFFNELRATVLRAHATNANTYCVARAVGDEKAQAAALDGMFLAWQTLQEIGQEQSSYIEVRQERGTWNGHHPPQLAPKERHPEQERAKRIAAIQLRSFGSVVKIETGNVEYRLREKRWRDRSDRFKR